MGINYYLLRNYCPHCGRADKDDVLHIGKSSWGWCFSLHVIEEDLMTIDDWVAEFCQANRRIQTEEGDILCPQEMIAKIQDRKGVEPVGEWWQPDFNSAEQYWRACSAEPGPNNLLRHAIDGRHCIGHGNGTWDYIIGDFS